MAGLPGEIVTNVAAHLDRPRDLLCLSLVNKRIYGCLEALLWQSLSIELWRYGESDSMGWRLLDLPDRVPAGKLKSIKVMGISIKENFRSPAATVYDISPILTMASNIQVLVIDLPFHRFLVNTENLRLKSLKLYTMDSYVKYRGNLAREVESATHDSVKALLDIPTLRHVELALLANLEEMIKNISLRDRSLHIKSFAFQSDDIADSDAICTFIRACDGLQAFHLNVDEKSGWNYQLEDFFNTLSEALEFQKDSLRILTISRQNCSKRVLYTTSRKASAMDPSRLTGLTCLSIPVLDLYDRVEDRLPLSLETLQLQIDGNIWNRENFDKRRAQIVEIMDSILDSRPNLYPKLRQVIWWFQGGADPPNNIETYQTSRKVDYALYKAKKGEVALAGVQLVWTETDSSNEHTFTAWNPPAKWRTFRQREDINPPRDEPVDEVREAIIEHLVQEHMQRFSPQIVDDPAQPRPPRSSNRPGHHKNKRSTISTFIVKLLSPRRWLQSKNSGQ